MMRPMFYFLITFDGPALFESCNFGNPYKVIGISIERVVATGKEEER